MKTLFSQEFTSQSKQTCNTQEYTNCGKAICQKLELLLWDAFSTISWHSGIKILLSKNSIWRGTIDASLVWTAIDTYKQALVSHPVEWKVIICSKFSLISLFLIITSTIFPRKDWRITWRRATKKWLKSFGNRFWLFPGKIIYLWMKKLFFLRI
jgi:hypothetical protein